MIRSIPTQPVDGLTWHELLDVDDARGFELHLAERARAADLDHDIVVPGSGGTGASGGGGRVSVGLSPGTVAAAFGPNGASSIEGKPWPVFSASGATVSARPDRPFPTLFTARCFPFADRSRKWTVFPLKHLGRKASVPFAQWRSIMRGMLAPLSPHEEATLRRIAFGSEGTLDPAHIRRLLQLDLIEWGGWTWQLTSLGQHRHEALVADGAKAAA